MSTPLREAASVILLRRGKSGGPPFEVFLLRRRKGASFMANAYVFPGGGAEADEDARTCAARELFEEAGVLLVRQIDRGDRFDDDTLNATLGDDSPAFSIASLRKKVLAGENASALLAKYELQWWNDLMIPWSHWITPSIEPKRFSARFFVCELPGGQRPSFDGNETVDEIWITPAEAIARAGELSLPPPQLRTMYELASLSSVQDVLAAAKVRAEEPHPILPRLRTMDPGDTGPTLLLPWDPDYAQLGTGDSAPLTYAPSWATGPSRFVLEDRTWKHVGASSAG